MIMMTGASIQAPGAASKGGRHNTQRGGCRSRKVVQRETSMKLECLAHKGRPHDFPSANMAKISATLEPFENKGLRTRWEVALNEMESYQAIPNKATNAAILRWRQVVVGRLGAAAVVALGAGGSATEKTKGGLEEGL